MRLFLILTLSISLFFASPHQSWASVSGNEQESLYLVTEPWPPFMGPELRQQGLMTHIVRAVLERMDVSMKLDFTPWARSIQMVKNQEADGILGIYATKERRQYLMFSDPVFVEQNALYTRHDSLISFSTIADLQPYSIGVVRDAANGEAFDRAQHLNKVMLTSNLQSIEMLLLGRVDLLAGPERVIEFIIEQQFPKKSDALVRLTPILGRMALTLAIHRKNPGATTFMQQFNQHLSELKQDGSYDRIIKQHGVPLLTDERILQQ